MVAVMNESGLTSPLPTPDPEVATRKPRKKELKNLTKREGIWYFQKRVNGKKEFNGRATPFTLATRDLVVAKAKRDAILKAANGVEVDRILGRLNRGAATLKEIFAAYRAAPTVRANATSRENNISDFTRLIRLVKGSEYDAEKFCSADLNKQLVKTWQGKRRALAEVECGQDLAALEAAKRSMNSLLTHVQSLFSAEAMDDYGALYLPPNVMEFATALPVAARKQEAPVQLADEVVTKLLGDVDGLRAVDAAAWTAFQLMVWGGLRNIECLHARAGWLEEIPLGYRLTMKPTEDFLPKGNSRAVILPADIVALILEQLPAVDPVTGLRPDDHLVQGKNKTDRHAACYRRLNAWLANQGVAADAHKVAYRLRKYFLSKMNEQQGLLIAQAAAGHSSFRTTQDHYVGKPTMKSPVKLGAGAAA